MYMGTLAGLIMLVILAVVPAASGAPEVPPEGIAKWDGKLREQIRKAIKAGRKPSFHSKKMNMKVTVKKVDASGDLWVATRTGMQFGVKWSRLVLSNKGSLAITAAGDDAKGHAIAAFYLLAQGKRREAAPHLRRAGDAADEARADGGSLSGEEAKLGASRARAPRAGRKPAPSRRAQRPVPWDIAALSKPPKVHPTNERPARGMRSFFYEGADYKGKPTWVFAYYATPKGKPPAGGWPAVVCAHGGGGSAFPDWVRRWNREGYAAISMDLEGHLPGGKHFGVEGNHPTDRGHKNAGPKRIGWFGDIALPDKEQWFYHAVADVIRANSLLRSFAEINSKKIGLTGISWGGTIVSAVAGLDPRFVFVIPVYGGGFIHKHDMTPDQYREYLSKWDPSAHLPYAKMPMLWVCGFNEPVFPLNLFSKSAGRAGGTSILCIRPFLEHGHGFGWDEVWEIGGFASGVVKGGVPMPRIGRPKVDPKDGLVHAKFKGPLKRAVVGFTTARAWKNRILSSIPCRIDKDEVIASRPLPGGTTAFMICGTGGAVWNDACVNSVLVDVK
ncbi:MAG: acetylxylan esterase [Planctomycetota bacterium]|jgi:dienelactone hydrolase